MRRTPWWTSEKGLKAGITRPRTSQARKPFYKQERPSRTEWPPGPQPNLFPERGHVRPDSSVAHISSCSPAVNI